MRRVNRFSWNRRWTSRLLPWNSKLIKHRLIIMGGSIKFYTLYSANVPENKDGTNLVAEGKDWSESTKRDPKLLIKRVPTFGEYLTSRSLMNWTSVPRARSSWRQSKHQTVNKGKPRELATSQQRGQPKHLRQQISSFFVVRLTFSIVRFVLPPIDPSNKLKIQIR